MQQAWHMWLDTAAACSLETESNHHVGCRVKCDMWYVDIFGRHEPNPGDSYSLMLQAGATWVASQGELARVRGLGTDWKVTRTHCAQLLAHLRACTLWQDVKWWATRTWLDPAKSPQDWHVLGGKLTDVGCQVLDRMAYQLSIFLCFTEGDLY